MNIKSRIVLLVLTLLAFGTIARAERFPNQGAVANTANLAKLFAYPFWQTAYTYPDGAGNIVSVPGLVQSNGRTIEFDAGEYRFSNDLMAALSPGWGYVMPSLSYAYNLTLTGSTNGQTVLNWLPSTSGSPAPAINFPDAAPANRSIHFDRLIQISESCQNITVSHLEFTSPDKYREQGAHIRICGSHVNINYCTFRNGPTFAIQINGDPRPSYIHIDNNSFIGTNGDGVHITYGYHIWASGNYFSNVRDDCFAAYHDNLNETDALTKFTEEVHFLDNIINIGGVHGVLFAGVKTGEVSNNVIYSTAKHSVAVQKLGGYETQRSTNISITDNTCGYVGSIPNHLGVDVVTGLPANTGFYAAAGVHSEDTDTITVSGNLIDHATYFYLGGDSWTNYYYWPTIVSDGSGYWTNIDQRWDIRLHGNTNASVFGNQRYQVDTYGNLSPDGNGGYVLEAARITY